VSTGAWRHVVLRRLDAAAVGTNCAAPSAPRSGPFVVLCFGVRALECRLRRSRPGALVQCWRAASVFRQGSMDLSSIPVMGKTNAIVCTPLRGVQCGLKVIPLQIGICASQRRQCHLPQARPVGQAGGRMCRLRQMCTGCKRQSAACLDISRCTLQS